MKTINHAQLAAYLFDEVTPAERAQVAAHLEANAEDRAMVAQWGTTLQWLDRWQVDDGAEAEEEAIQPGDLVAHLYEENEIDLAHAPAARRQVETWRETLAVLDAWQVADPVRKARPASRFLPALMKAAAMGTVLLSVGFLAGRKASPTNQVEANVQEALESKLAALAAQQQEHSKQILASLETRRPLNQNLAALRAQKPRNQLLANFLPPTEQEKYHAESSKVADKLRKLEQAVATSDRIIQTIAHNVAARGATLATLPPSPQ